MIPDYTLDDIRERIDLAALIGADITLRRTGPDHVGLCPFHSEQTPSLSVSPGKGVWKCFGCGVGGDAFGWMTRHHGLTFPAAAAELARRAGVSLPEDRRTPEQAARDEAARAKATRARAWVVRANEIARDVYAEYLHHDMGAEALTYLLGRGLRADTLRDWGVGWAPPEGCLLTHLIARGSAGGIDAQTMRRTALAAGLAGQTDDGYTYERFRGRVMFPIADRRGEVVGFGGRILPGAGAEVRPPAKYKNTPESDVFKKRGLLYGLDRAAPAIREAGHVAVVEGYADVIMAHQGGRGHVVACLGTALTDDHARAIRRTTDRVTLHYDHDEAGRRASIEAALTLQRAGLTCSIARETPAA